MSQTLRMNCVQVIVQPDLSIYYRLTFPIKPHHRHLFNSDKIQAFSRNNKVRYMYVLESSNRVEILRHMVSAQSVVNEAKLIEHMQRQTILLNKLAQL